MPRKQQNAAPLPGTSLLRLRRVKEKTGLATSSVYDLMARDEFPKPVPLSERRVAWISSEVDAWIEARIAARNQKPERIRLSRKGADDVRSR